MPDKLTLAKDWIYAICTPIQTVLAFGALILANVFWKMKERSDSEARKSKEDRETKEKLAREKREREERLDREEREKIADLFSREYNAIESKFEKMKKILSSLQSTPIVAYRRRTVSALDVLRYMCQPDHRNDFNNQELKNFCVDVDEIVKLFRNFRIKLPPAAFGRQCPENIKEELGPSIIEIASYVFPFVSSTRQKTITEVLSYFGAATPSNGTDIGNLREEIPYLNYLRLKDGEIAFDTTSMFGLDSHILNIANLIEEKKTTSQQIEDIFENLKKFWDSCSATSSSAATSSNVNVPEIAAPCNTLHLIRMTLDKLCRSTQPDAASEDIMAYFEQLDREPVLNDMTIHECKRFIDDLTLELSDLKESHHLLRQEATAEFLKKLYRTCNAFMKAHVT